MENITNDLFSWPISYNSCYFNNAYESIICFTCHILHSDNITQFHLEYKTLTIAYFCLSSPVSPQLYSLVKYRQLFL